MTIEREQRLLELIMSDPSIILIIKTKCITEDMWKVAIANEPPLFQHIKNPSEEIVLFALNEDGANIQYLEKMGIPITKKMIYTAIKNYPNAIFLIPKEYITNEIKEYAVDKEPSLIRDLRLKGKSLSSRIKEDPTLVRFLSNPTEDQLYEALKITPNMCAYIEEYTPKLKELMYEKYPDVVPLIPALSKSFIPIKTKDIEDGENNT